MDNESGTTNAPLHFCYGSTSTESPYGFFINSSKKYSKMYGEYVHTVEYNHLYNNSNILFLKIGSHIS